MVLLGALTHIACTRMYNACPAVTAFWAALTEEISRMSGVPLRFETYPYPMPIEKLWERPDLGLVFICGRAFALGGMRHKALAVPVRVSATGQSAGNAASSYHTKILVRRDSPFTGVQDLFGKRIGWTVEHSMSGYLALKLHLESRFGEDAGRMLANTSGPLHTPANCLKALKEGTVDAAPVDGYFYDLLWRNEPAALAHTRVVAVTREYPMPLLAASPQAGDTVCASLRTALRGAANLPRLAPALDGLGLKGFSGPVPEDYAFMAENGDSPHEPARQHCI
ncbi:MAG: phosphate/phosphite/phosphonate ABC transporter substrate-binding protein [Desulfovibrio sp.]|jgi:ABC-type phosphate/phosphonate transport system substrate-binding protein|nr:phosphate/phosphite/phosphonate ABC transporter substrate-binding protein [Desulfovibrio sp.]